MQCPSWHENTFIVCWIVCFFNYCPFQQKQSVPGNIHSLESFFSHIYIICVTTDRFQQIADLPCFWMWQNRWTIPGSANSHSCSGEAFKGGSKLDESCCGGGGERTKTWKKKGNKTKKRKMLKILKRWSVQEQRKSPPPVAHEWLARKKS